MRSVIHMHNSELFEKFGTGRRGSRVVTSQTVQWLLTDPDEGQIAARTRVVEVLNEMHNETLAEPFKNLFGNL